MKGLRLSLIMTPLAVMVTGGFTDVTTPTKDVPTVGATIAVSRGTLTVHTYEQPAAVSVSAPTIQPRAGHEFSAIDVEACNRTTQALALNPYQFSLEKRDHSRVHPAAATREPVLHETSVGPQDCVRGWITFAVRRHVVPRSVIFQSGSSFNRTLRLVRWRITKDTTVSTTTAVRPARKIAFDDIHRGMSDDQVTAAPDGAITGGSRRRLT